MDDDISVVIAPLVAAPLMDLVNIKVIQIAVRRIFGRRLRFMDAYLAVASIRILAGEVNAGWNAQDRLRSDFKESSAKLAKILQDRIEARESGRKRVEKVFLG
jgi:hypothetical protein